jgi:hypothetical protein
VETYQGTQKGAPVKQNSLGVVSRQPSPKKAASPAPRRSPTEEETSEGSKSEDKNASAFSETQKQERTAFIQKKSSSQETPDENSLVSGPIAPASKMQRALFSVKFQKNSSNNSVSACSKASRNSLGSGISRVSTLTYDDHKDRRFSKQKTNKVQKKGKFRWLRRTASKDISPSQIPPNEPTSTAPIEQHEQKESPQQREEVAPRKILQETTPLQMQLWIAVVRKSIVEAKTIEEQKVKKLVKIKEEEKLRAHGHEESTDHYFRKSHNTGVYVDYSTFDDGESVSSIDLLFKWLTCRELGTEDKKKRTVVDAQGMVVAADSMTSETVSSLEEDARPRRRMLFTR